MALDSYANLKTAVENRLLRSGASDPVIALTDDFIDDAEAQINRDLRVRRMETRATFTTTANGQYIPLTPTYLEMRNVQINTSPVRVLNYATPYHLDLTYGGSYTGKPRYYTITGAEVQLAPIPDDAYTVEMLFYGRIPSLGAAQVSTDGFVTQDTMNWLLTAEPDLYLAAVLKEAFEHARDPANAERWSVKYLMAVEKLKEVDQAERWSGSPLQPRSAQFVDDRSYRR